MKSIAPAYNQPVEPTAEAQRLLMPVTISVIGHFFLLGLFVFTPNFSADRELPAGAISVNLVAVPSFTSAAPPGKKTDAPPAKKASVPTPKPKVASKPKVVAKPKVVVPPQKPPEMKAPVAVETPPKAPEKEAISLAPKPVTPKVSLKKKTYQADKIVESAIKRIEQETAETGPEAGTEQTESNSLKDALDRMRAAVEEKEAASGGGGTTEGGIGQDATGVGGGLGGTGKPRPLDSIDIYSVEIAHRIQMNWAYSEQMSDSPENLTAWIMVEIAQNGEIRDFWFEKRSGSAYLDESAAKAIQKSNPLPPFPEGVRQQTIHLGFRFTPTGIK